MRSFWLSPVASAMTVNERALFWELISLHTGSNNGLLFLSVKDATHRIGLNDYTAGVKAFEGLIGLGLVTVTASASFNVKASDMSRARAFRLNWIDEHGQPKPGEAFDVDLSALAPERRRRIERRMRSLKTFVRDREQGKFAVRESLTMVARMDSAAIVVARESLTPNYQNGEKVPFEAVRDSLAYLDYHGDRGLMCRTDLMRAVRNDNSTTTFVRSPHAGHPRFCDLIKLRRGIKDNLKKSGPNQTCEKCGGGLDPEGRAGRRFCSETCRKAAEARRRYERSRVAA